jgi:hypothetical protein
MPRARKPKKGINCSSTCQTKSHYTFGECLKDKGIRAIGYQVSRGRDDLNRTDRELSAFRDAVNQGVQPDGTTKQKVEDAMILSNEKGAAYGVDFNVATSMEGI